MVKPMQEEPPSDRRGHSAASTPLATAAAGCSRAARWAEQRLRRRLLGARRRCNGRGRSCDHARRRRVGQRNSNGARRRLAFGHHQGQRSRLWRRRGLFGSWTDLLHLHSAVLAVLRPQCHLPGRRALRRRPRLIRLLLVRGSMRSRTAGDGCAARAECGGVVTAAAQTNLDRYLITPADAGGGEPAGGAGGGQRELAAQDAHSQRDDVHSASHRRRRRHLTKLGSPPQLVHNGRRRLRLWLSS